MNSFLQRLIFPLMYFTKSRGEECTLPKWTDYNTAFFLKKSVQLINVVFSIYAGNYYCHFTLVGYGAKVQSSSKFGAIDYPRPLIKDWVIISIYYPGFITRVLRSHTKQLDDPNSVFIYSISSNTNLYKRLSISS